MSLLSHLFSNSAFSLTIKAAILELWGLFRVISCRSAPRIPSLVIWPDRSSEQCKNRTGSARWTRWTDSGCVFYVVGPMLPTGRFNQPLMGCGPSLASIQINTYIHRLNNETRGDSLEVLLPCCQRPSNQIGSNLRAWNALMKAQLKIMARVL